MPASFFDSNILLYFVSDDLPRSERAKTLVYGGGTVSVQVLNEVVSVTRGKMHLSWTEIGDVLFVFRGLLEVVPLTISTHERGVALAARHRLHIYDALIAAAALEAGCDVLYSEDMHHGLVLDDRLTVVNPFA